MAFDLDLVRAILRQFGVQSDSAAFLDTEGVTLSPPSVVGFNPASVPEHVDRLVHVGLIRRTRDIRMRNHPDPVSLRITEAGRPWVRRAYDDSQWEQSRLELEHLLEAGTRN